MNPIRAWLQIDAEIKTRFILHVIANAVFGAVFLYGLIGLVFFIGEGTK